MIAASPDAADPFGLWESVVDPSARGDEGLSFDLPGSANGEGDHEVQGAVWRVCGPEDLEVRAHQVQAVQNGLSSAEIRIAEFLKSQADQRKASGAGVGNVSFDLGGLASLPPDSPEGRLLLSMENGGLSQEAVSFGILDGLNGGPDWQGLQNRLTQLIDSANRQLLNFAWIETEISGVLLARTTIHWSGDMTNVLLPEATPNQILLHRRSLALAIESRQASLKTVTSVASIAGSLALAFTTPLGPVRLMALAWQFISDVMMPFLKSASSS